MLLNLTYAKSLKREKARQNFNFNIILKNSQRIFKILLGFLNNLAKIPFSKNIPTNNFELKCHFA